MSKSEINLHNKAMDYYKNGKLDKALECCETGISRDLKNSNLLNLKGLLLYLRGDLQEAIAVWKINKEFNNDDMSKVYIDDSKNDNQKIDLFHKAQMDIKEFRVDEAIIKLKECAASDFNSIKVNNALAISYLRKGEYETAKIYVEKSLKIDKYNKGTLLVKAEIENFLKSPKDDFIKGIIKIALGILIITLSIGAVYIIKLNNNNKVVLEENNPTDSNEILINDNQEGDTTVEDVTETNEEEKIDDIIPEVTNITQEELQEKYIQASELFEEEKYTDVINLLQGVVNNSLDIYLNEHVLFLLSTSYQYSNDINNSNKYYEEYSQKYINGSYIEEVCYKLALNYKDSNLEKSKEYAVIIKDNYPKSIYNNSVIDEIISN